MELTIHHHPDSGRLLAQVEAQPAGYIEYRLREANMAILHTIVDPAYEGQGVGSALAQEALAIASDNGWAVLPYCPFIQAYLLKHPQLQSLVPAEQRAAFRLPPA